MMTGTHISSAYAFVLAGHLSNGGANDSVVQLGLVQLPFMCMDMVCKHEQNRFVATQQLFKIYRIVQETEKQVLLVAVPVHGCH
jgi:hypothetical protein